MSRHISFPVMPFRERTMPTPGTGLVGDGKSDDGEAFRSWFLSNPDKTLVLEEGRQYRVNARIFLPVQVSLDLNGATILASRGFLMNWSRVTISAASEGTGTFGDEIFRLDEGSGSFVRKGAGAIAVGDILNFWAMDNCAAAGSYKEGFWARAVAVAGSDIRFEPACPVEMRVKVVMAYKPLNSRIGCSNPWRGAIDVRFGGKKSAEDMTQRNALRIIGDSPCVFDISVSGDDDSECGILMEGMSPTVRNCSIRGFTDVQGTGTGRLGYGINLGGDVAWAFGNDVRDCKHGITTATSRNYRTSHAVFVGNRVSTPAGSEDVIVAPGGARQPKYQGMIDAHASTRNCIVEKNLLIGVNNAVALRTKGLIRDNRIINLGVPSDPATGYCNDGLVLIYESPMSVLASNNVMSVASASRSRAWAFILQAYASVSPPVPHGNIDCVGLSLAGNIGLFTIRHDQTAKSGDISVGDIVFDGVSGELAAGIQVPMTMGETLGSVGNVRLSLEAGAQISEPIMDLSGFSRVGNASLKR